VASAIAPAARTRFGRRATRERRRASTGAVAPSAGELQSSYGLKDSVAFESGEGGLTKVVLTHVCGSSAEIYLYGACVTSWKQASGDEVLYVRPDAKFDMSKAISGGIPLCFPQFGPGEMKQHGFARDSLWRVASTSADYNPDDRDPCVELVLEDSDETRACGFAGSFKVSYSITLHRETLQTDFRVINTGDAPFEFTAALHSYFEVAGVENASVSGLEGLAYLDKVPNPTDPKREPGSSEELRIAGETDRIYEDAPSEVVLKVGTGAGVQIQNENWSDCVVWNPWTSMEACYKEFVCVENAKTAQKVRVGPNESWRARADFAVVDLI